MKFHKMHGISNDYIYFNCLENDIEDKVSLTKFVSDRHKGIGSDGAIFICKSDKADAEMVMYNWDGSYSEMCGNGIRCVAKYLFDFGIVDKTSMVIESGGALKYINVHAIKETKNEITGKTYSRRADGMVAEFITVDMGKPFLKPEQIPACIPGYSGDFVTSYPLLVDTDIYNVTLVSVGNPHAITFVEDVKNFPVEQVGRKIESHEWFPKKTNVEFVRVINRNEVEMRVCERGAGETFACGTGATATAVACVLNGLTDNNVKVHLLGGDLSIKWDRESDHVYMTGPAEFVCEGDI